MPGVPFVFIGLPGCTPDSSLTDDSGAGPADVAERLAAPGPWAVGYRVSAVTYADPAGEGDRTLRLAAWYPSEATSGTTPTYAGIWPSAAAWTDAAVAPGSFPVVVFSHGHQGYAENSSFLMEHFASHGWVAVAPDHTGNTLFDGPDRKTAIYYRRPLDISAVLDHLAALPAGDPLHGHLAAPTVALGHSFGGYTVLALAGAAYDLAGIEAGCVADPSDPLCSDLDDAALARFAAGFGDDRLAAAIPMAPGDYARFGADGVAAVFTPTLLMTASEDQPPGSEADALWAALGGDPHLRVVLEGGGHQSFTDYADQLEDVPLDREEGFRVVRVYALARALAAAGDAEVAAILDGSAPVSDSATLLR